MKVLLASLILLQGAPAQTAPAMPAWLVPYPGADATTRASAVLIEAAYQTPAAPADVVAHYQKLFAAAGLPFHANPDGIGSAIRGSAPECDLLIQIRERQAGSSVRVSCAAKSPEMTETVPPPVEKPTYQQRVAKIHEDSQKAIEAHWDGVRASNEKMEKYDQPVYPTAKPPLPPLAWPEWLVSCEGSQLNVQKGVDQFKLSYLKTTFTSGQDRAKIQAFYAHLLSVNGYAVEFQSNRAAPANAKVMVQGSYYPGEKPGPRISVRAEITPVDIAQQVELRVTRRP
jgi:hypothetical protein